ncbi:YhcN/YlaJ family sporulation lipoprotein [Pseudalkalibacillus berkeleyi]|uniref:YhcN/YlaJ family sporulation lipoprotein n=1 Tax=Pseudalkalibacillus berkeleyi TaxID=1069813 RepID=A0ABS9GX20_9BACL|nr:YhcN/YlaJ family sporulation lipoprotein [Pseudalkalibacillus berkeleyi]MCF6137342.1 YhcN/YlaJ family sporulation lipoprotein [Pseudalkalibacillus berkeleyi]
MIQVKKMFLVPAIIMIIVLGGCKEEQSSDMKNTISTKELSVQESSSIHEEIKKVNGVDDVKLIHSKDQLLVAIKITTMDRFRIEEIQHKVQKKLDAAYPEMDVTISPDKKIFMKIGELESKQSEKSLTERDIHKKVRSLIKLSKDKG